MSSRQTPVGFSISDLFIRIIPGAIVVTTFILPELGLSDYIWDLEFIQSPPDNATLLLVLFALFSLVIGEVLDVIRGNLVPVPYLFRRIIYEKTGERECLSVHQQIILGIVDRKPKRWILQQLVSLLRGWTWDLGGGNFRWEINDDSKISMSNEEPDAGFLDYYRKQMGITPTFSDPRLLYLSLYNHLDGQMSSMTRQYQTAYNAIVNFELACITSILFMVVQYGMRSSATSEQQSVAFILCILLIFLYIIVKMLSKTYANLERLYIESLLVEYLLTERSQ